jgi:SRSO17 transposase
MERRYRVRLAELLDDAHVPPNLLRGVLPPLQTFLQPFLDALQTPQQQTNAPHYLHGLLSELGSKDVESIAYLHDRQRQGLHKFIGQADWDYQPLLTELARQVGRELGHDDGVLVFDPSAFPKQGKESVGVQRQWCGRLGKIDTGQVGISLGSVSRSEHALVDVRLYLPKEWARRKRRRHQAGVPAEVRFRTRHELALQMLDERGPLLPHAWISGDDELGRCSGFREQLRSRNECYLLAVPCNTLVRDRTATAPTSEGHGRRRRAPFVSVQDWCAALPESAWETIEVRDGEKGPLVVQVALTLVQARMEGRVSERAEWLVVFRERQGDGSYKHDYLLSHAPLTTEVSEFARVFKAQHRIEECLRRAKGEAGLGDYQVRTWSGWHHHQTLALLATWFLTQETRRGKKADAGVDGCAGGGFAGVFIERAFGLSSSVAESAADEPSFASQRGSTLGSLATT